MFFNILATFAELEADLIRLRTREGTAIARIRGECAASVNLHGDQAGIFKGISPLWKHGSLRNIRVRFSLPSTPTLAAARPMPSTRFPRTREDRHAHHR